MELENKIEITTQFLDDSQIISRTGSWNWNVMTNEVHWSKNMFRLLGLAPDEVAPSYELALHHVCDSDKKRYEETLSQAIENKTTYYFENKIVQRDKSVISVVSSGKCILDENKNLIRMIGVVQDISIQKEIEKIKEEKQRAEDRDKVKSLILKMIAHDIKNPFHHINGFSELLIENIQNKEFEDAITYGKIIHEATNQTLKILDGLLQWAFTDSISSTFNRVTIAPKNLVDDVIGFLNVQLIKKKLIIKNLIDPKVCIDADKHMLMSIVRNLISNAIKYCNRDGEITIALQSKKNQNLISISDTGVGITPKTLENLFDPSKIISKKGTEQEKGSGLGLQICKALVDRHDGKIWFDSEIGIGTTCYFTLSKNEIDQRKE
jgi:signal transduction histidine kinase